MAIKQESHIIKGIQRDLTKSKFSPEYAFDAYNIRITAREGDTLMSVTNEKGTKKVPLVSVNTEDTSLVGTIIGHTVLNEFVIIFTTDNDEGTLTDRIYRLLNKGSYFEFYQLYSGNLNFSTNNPIESLGVFENDNILKVYWVDGLNQPRVINIVKDRLVNNYTYNNTSFDFVQELKLNESIVVEKVLLGNGVFAPGTIQYAFTYYNKYGLESNIFDISELHYISYPNRGASPTDKINNSFSITIGNVDTNFDYLRIYSIHRTSIDSTPVVKSVTDLSIELKGTLTYIDNGTTGETIDPTQLLYIGGESIIAGTITQKDNTLFLGNLKISRPSISEALKTDIRNALLSKIETITREIAFNTGGEEGHYSYSNQLSKGNTAGFKSGEHYRIGVQFQYKTGKWSEPIFIKDYTISNTSNTRPSLNEGKLLIPNIQATLLELNIRTELKKLGYKKYRGIVVFPALLDRLIVTLGMLCPTVFMAGSRRNNTPFAQSSWFIRPNLPYDVLAGLIGNSDAIDNGKHVDKGAWVEFRHLHALKSRYDRGAEILNMTGSFPFYAVNNAMLLGSDDKANVFMVDQSVITLHSPDIEFDSSFSSLDGSNLKLRIVGLINFTASVGDIDILTSSPTIHSESTGFVHRSLGVINRNKLASRSLVSGLFYKDYLVDEFEDAEKFGPYSKLTYEYGFMVYPWHRSGSLNNDINRPEGRGTRSAVLLKKVISNLKFSDFNTWLDVPWDALELATGITNIQLFNSNEVSLIKLPIPKNSGIANMNYYGNVDSLVPPSEEYGIVFSLGSKDSQESPFNDGTITDTIILFKDDDDDVGDKELLLKKTKEPVRIKYKSTPHIVFGFNYAENTKYLYILPRVNDLNNPSISTKQFWTNPEPLPEVTYENILYREIFNPNSIFLVEAELLWAEPIINADGTISEYCNLYECSENLTWEKVELVESDALYKYEGFTTYIYKIVEYGDGYVLLEIDYLSSNDPTVIQSNIEVEGQEYPYLFLAELYREKVTNPFGGEDYKSNLWLPAGKSVSLDTETIYYEYGDTWYQRYDCLKTYPFTREDENQIVEIASFMCETRTNIDGRYDRNRGQASNLNMSPTNFNLLNPIYSQKDNFFNYRILDSDFYKLDKFSNSITWTKEKSLSEEVDTWTNITMASTLDLDGDKGVITSLNTFNNEIYCFQQRGLSNILFNSRVLIPTSDGLPIEITNGLKVLGKRYISSIGCNNKWSITETPIGLYFIDEETSSLYLFNGLIGTISGNLGFSQWISEYSNMSVWNPKDFSNFISYYDKTNGDVYFINKNKCLCYSERIGLFTSFMSYENIYPMFNVSNKLYSFKEDLWEHFAGEYNMFYNEFKPYSFTVISNADMPYDKIFNNIEFRSDSWDNDILINDKTFDTLEVWNEYLYGKSLLVFNLRYPSNLKKKFRVWRANIPRDSNNFRDRIRNTWAYIKLSMNTPNTYKTEFHDLIVSYFV